MLLELHRSSLAAAATGAEGTSPSHNVTAAAAAAAGGPVPVAEEGLRLERRNPNQQQQQQLSSLPSSLPGSGPVREAQQQPGVVRHEVRTSVYADRLLY